VEHSAEDYFLLFQKGEERGFDYFFQLYYKPLVHFAYTFLCNTEAAEDIACDSFLKLWEKRASIGSKLAIKPYLYAVVRNACIDILRKQKHQNAYTAYIKKTERDFQVDTSQNIIISESMHQVHLAVQRLPAKYQQVFKMLYVEGKEVKDIATELNLPLSTVKSQKTRTLELLRKELPHLGFLLPFLLLSVAN
jgi:RNA polymerase sigma-70 factor, ECF subfamily